MATQRKHTDVAEPSCPAEVAGWAETRFPGAWGWRALSRNDLTIHLICRPEQFIVKRIGQQSRSDFIGVSRSASATAVGPELVDVVDSQEACYAVLRFVEGTQPLPGDDRWLMLWSYVPIVHERVSALPPQGPDLVAQWMERLSSFAFPEESATRLLRRLQSSRPDGIPTMTHGDFSLQNMVLTEDRIVMIDWEQAGAAPAGFDAGWLLALMHTGLIPTAGEDQAALSARLTGGAIEPCVVRWYRALGLLRLLYRAHTLPLSQLNRLGLRARILLAVHTECASDPADRL
jgi:hypothetical protein